MNYLEKDNLGTRQDTKAMARDFWKLRLMYGIHDPFVLYYFNSEEDACNALLDLPYIHLAEDSQKLISTEVLTFGYYKERKNEIHAFISSKSMTIAQYERIIESFSKYGGKKINFSKPSQTSNFVQKPQIEISDKVFFFKEETKKVFGTTYTYRIYKGSDRATAMNFLVEHPVTQNYLYLVVETPEGTFSRDIEGIYQE